MQNSVPTPAQIVAIQETLTVKAADRFQYYCVAELERLWRPGSQAEIDIGHTPCAAVGIVQRRLEAAGWKGEVLIRCPEGRPYLIVTSHQ